jgi:SAM-dependent methyltransferase
MTPHGLSILAYHQGNTFAALLIRRDDGEEKPLPVSHYFRSPEEFSAIESAALNHCRGHVLDIGAGSGTHSLFLQSRGMLVTAIEISPPAAQVLSERGVSDVHCTDVYDFEGGPFDSLLMLGHGIGMVEDMSGLERFLVHARRLTKVNGDLLVHSVNVSTTDDLVHLAYHESNRRAGRYIGEVRIQLQFEENVGPYCGWLHIDPQTLALKALKAGWKYEMLLEENDGDYLARLTRV